MERLILPQNEMFVRPSSCQSVRPDLSTREFKPVMQLYIYCLVDEDVRLN